MNRHLLLLLPLLLFPAATWGQTPDPIVAGLKNPESVAVGMGGKVYVSVIGEFGKDGDGAVVRIDGTKVVPLAEGLNDPKGLAAYQKWLFVADKDRIVRIDEKGKTDVYVRPEDFPARPLFLNDVVADPETGILYVSDSGDLKGQGGVVYGIVPIAPKKKGKKIVAPAGVKVRVVVDGKKMPALHTPNGLVMDGRSFLLMGDFGTGKVHRIRIADGQAEEVAAGMGGIDGLAWDRWGRLYVSSWKEGKVFVIARPGDRPKQLPQTFESAADLCLAPDDLHLLIPDMKKGSLHRVPAQVPGAPVDFSPLPVETVHAFPKIQWTGWEGETAKGTINFHRPIVLTHAGDGSDRIFLATQHGVVHVFPNDPKVGKTKIFLDISKKVQYADKTNEEGFLGLAFPPHYRKTGEFYVFYTPREAKLVNVLSRFRVSKDDPDRADPASEEVLLRIQRPFWNHDGGTLAFGPDGYLYIAVGDGGAANDPFDNAQNLKTLLGNILRIDVDRKGEGQPYAIPKDNPFVGKKDARPEIWAYGLRNVWRLSFDAPTKRLWAADVGQNLYEEINLIEKGGNYGWNRREALHPFGDKGVGPRKDLIDPIWEYHHDVGRSVTGGHVYRGKALPELDGAYIYGDYVSNRIWALKVDDKAERVVANRPIRDRSQPILSFGQDEQGEVYLLTFSPTGQGIYRFARKN